MNFYFAHDPAAYFWMQSGWFWLLTPVKDAFHAYGWQHVAGVYSWKYAQVPWWDLYLYEDHYLDLRVALADLLILAFLMIVTPFWFQRRRADRIWALTSATSALIFGLAIAAYGWFAFSVWWVILVSAMVAIAMYGASLMLIFGGNRHKGSK